MMFDKNLAVSMVALQQMYYTYNDNLTRTLFNTNEVIYCHHLTRVNKSTPNIPFFSGKEKKKKCWSTCFILDFGLLFLDVLLINMFEKEPDYFF